MIVADKMRRFFGVGRLPVMCCCRPDNVLGTAPADAPGVVREWEDDRGRTGLAFCTHHGDQVVGFRAGRGKKGGKRGGGKKTWKDKRR